MGTICINRSGQELTVTTGPGVNYGSLGTLKPNEVFTWLGAWPGNGWGYEYQNICFKAEDGVLREGYIMTADLGSAITPITACNLFEVTLNADGKKTYAFNLRHPVNMYSTSGEYIRTLAAETLVFTNSGVAGASNKDWMYIDYYGGLQMWAADAFIDIGNTSMLFDECPLVGTLR